MTLGVIEDFISRYPHAYHCDQRLHQLKAHETIRNIAETYTQKNHDNVPTIEEIQVYFNAVHEQMFTDLASEIWITEKKGYSLHDGLFNKLSRDDGDEVHTALICAMPLQITSITQSDTEYLIHYSWLETHDVKDIDDFLLSIPSKLHMTGNVKMKFSEFITEMVGQARDQGIVSLELDPVYIDDDGGIRVSVDTTKYDNRNNLRLIREFYDRTTHQQAYLVSFAMGLIAPLSYEIKKRSISGYIFPVPVFFGRTELSKTSTIATFVQYGFSQTKDEAVMPRERIRTPFMFMKMLTKTTLPVIYNDVDDEWFESNKDTIKSMTENAVVGARGRANQDYTDYPVKRYVFISSNEIINPSDDASRNRRYILCEFNADIEKRKNPKAYSEFITEIQPGFMFGLIDEIFGGMPFSDLLKAVTATKDGWELVQVILTYVNTLAKTYGIPEFPLPHTMEIGVPDDDFMAFIQYCLEQWHRLEQTDDYGRPRGYVELSKSEIDIDDMNDGTYIIWFVGNAFRKASRRLGLKHERATSLIKDYVRNDTYGVLEKGDKSHKFDGVPMKAFAIWYRGEWKI